MADCWDDVMAGPHPSGALGKLRKSLSLNIDHGGVGEGSSSKYQKGAMPGSPVGPATPTTPSPTAARKDNVWRSVFHPGSNLATKSIGADVFDKPKNSNSPTVYDWLYSGDSRSQHR
ncbi:unnamed protein product [Cuscuta epithymum]|uniref:Auxin-repressed protein n=1 Tax=Cuscuta epithymum TaxID=186058 RepID=A0AAV0CN17_9ASTE|nr:unnamed protein product [Cuscuta epithymum]